MGTPKRTEKHFREPNSLPNTQIHSEQKQNKILEERTFFFLLVFLNSENVLISLA